MRSKDRTADHRRQPIAGMASRAAGDGVLAARTLAEAGRAIARRARGVDAGSVLLAFDIDMTLIQPDHPAISFPNRERFRDTMKRAIGPLTPRQNDLMMNLLIRRLPARLVEPSGPEVIRSFQHSGFKAIAFSGALTAPLGDVGPSLAWRHLQLRQNGFDFSGAFACPGELRLAGLGVYLGGEPAFGNGILLSNGEGGETSKGSVLAAFLARIGYAPRAVVLVDDKRKNLDEVGTALQAFDPAVAFLGIHYTGGLARPLGAITEAEMFGFWKDAADHARTSQAARAWA